MPEPIRRALSSACTSLLHGLLRRNPVERLTFEEFFSHPFLRSGSRSSSSHSGSRHSSQSSSLTTSAEPSPMKPADRCGPSLLFKPYSHSPPELLLSLAHHCATQWVEMSIVLHPGAAPSPLQRLVCGSSPAGA